MKLSGVMSKAIKLLLTELIGQCTNILPLAFSASSFLRSVNTEKAEGNIFLYCLTKISIRAKRSISRVFSLFIVPSPFFVHCPYKGRINRAESVLIGLKPY